MASAALQSRVVGYNESLCDAFMTDSAWFFQSLFFSQSKAIDQVRSLQQLTGQVDIVEDVQCKDSYSCESSEMRTVFERFDENNDGLICAKDLTRFMKRLGYEISEQEAVSLVRIADQNNDGEVDFDEFYSLYKSLSDEAGTSMATEEAKDEEFLEAFLVFDRNGDGFISCQELQAVLLDLGLPEGQSLKSCERMIERVDADGNGQIDLTEFKHMML